MARKRAESADQASFWAVNAAAAPGIRCRPTMASPLPSAMIGFAPFHGASGECRIRALGYPWRRPRAVP